MATRIPVCVRLTPRVPAYDVLTKQLRVFTAEEHRRIDSLAGLVTAIDAAKDAPIRLRPEASKEWAENLTWAIRELLKLEGVSQG